MKALRAVIVDDEPLARRGVRQLLSAHADIELAGEARNGKEAVRMIKSLSPDLVFLDVQMPELDGFAVLRRLSMEAMPWVIFVTAHDEYAVRAFEQHALDYLLKPIHEDRFHRAVERARETMRSREAVQLSRRLSQLVNDGLGVKSLLDGIPKSPRPLAIGLAGNSLIFDPAEIDWIEAQDYYATVHAGGHGYLVRESLASLESRLDPECFVRVHRSAMVNLAAIRSIDAGSNGDAIVLLRDGTAVPLSRRRRRHVADALRRRVV